MGISILFVIVLVYFRTFNSSEAYVSIKVIVANCACTLSMDTVQYRDNAEIGETTNV